MLALLKAGADPKLKNKRGETVFDMHGLTDQAMRELARFAPPRLAAYPIIRYCEWHHAQVRRRASAQQQIC